MIYKLGENDTAEAMQRSIWVHLQQSPNDDSDTDSDSSSSSDTNNVNNINNDNEIESDSDIESVEEERFVQRDGWIPDTTFDRIDSKSRFENEFMRKVTRSNQWNNNDSNTTNGIQCAVGSINLPMKAWTEIFTYAILEKIVKYTNEYGEMKDKNWETINHSNLIDFIAVLFVSEIQKRKDRVSNWWSNNPLQENVVMKCITRAYKFMKMMRLLHVASVDNQPQRNDVGYNPIYKVKEFMDYIEMRGNKLFVPGRTLSLDEKLIRAFGRMKFKV